jgi:hypothetical protein
MTLFTEWEDADLSPSHQEHIWNLGKKIIGHVIVLGKFKETNPFSQFEPPSNEGDNVIRMPGFVRADGVVFEVDMETMDIIR